MGNGEKPVGVNRDEDGSCLTGGAKRMDPESSGQGKRQADNHHVKRPPKKKRRSEDEDSLGINFNNTGAADDVVLKSDLDINYTDEVEDYEDDGETEDEVLEAGSDLDRIHDDDDDDRDASSEEVLKVGTGYFDDDSDDDASSEEVLKVGTGYFDDDSDDAASSEEVLKVGTGYFDDDSDDDASSEEVLKVGTGYFDDDSDDDASSEEVLKVGAGCFDDDRDASSEEVYKVGIDLDRIHESEMKCDSEGLNEAKGSNEMAGGLISWGQFRKARCSGPFVAGSVKFKDCDGNVINCIELGTGLQQIGFDVDLMDSDNPKFILLVEKRSVAKDFYRVLFDLGYRCIIVATRRRSLDDATKQFVCKLRKMSNLQVYALFDCSPHFIRIMLDLTLRDRMDLIWLGIQPGDVPALLEIGPEIPATPNPRTDQFMDLFAQSYPPQAYCILEQLSLMIMNGRGNVPIKAFPPDTLIQYYLPKLLCDSGVPGF